MNLLRRLRWWFSRRQESDQLTEEMAFHEEMKRRELEGRGYDSKSAALAAKRAMGNTTLMREDARGVWLAPWLERLGQDIKFALRSAIKNPTFSLGVIGISGLGIGATTTMFSVVDGVILKPLPYPGAERMVWFDWGSHSPPRFRDWQREMTSVEQWGAVWTELQDLVGGGEPERLPVARVSTDFFSLFAARPALGRLFTAEDYAGDGQVVVLSDRLWRRRFGADPNILGRALSLGGKQVTVVGVLDPSFVEPEQVSRPGGLSVDRKSAGTAVWLPLVYPPNIAEDERYSILDVSARLKPGLSIDGFRRELAALAPRLAAANPKVHGDGEGGAFAIPIMALQQRVVGDATRALVTLLAAVGLMLLIACANVINLYLARSTDRQRELAVRAAIGAGRGRLFRQLITESVTLGMVGGAVGVLAAILGVKGLTLLFPGDLPRAGEIAINGRVLLFALLVSLVTGVVFGLVPAYALRERRSYQAIRGSGPAAGPGRSRIRSGLVVAEIALALMLLVGSGLLFHSLLRMVRVDPGFDAESLTMARLQLGDQYPAERRLNFAAAIRDRLAKAPGVATVTVGVAGPAARTGGSRCCWGNRKVNVDGRVVEGLVLVHPVGEGFFETVGARLRGTTVTDRDAGSDPVAAVISEPLATKLWGQVDPIGKTFETVGKKLVVRGVVSGLRLWGLDQEAETEIFVSYRQFGGEFDALNVIAKSAVPGVSLVPVVRQAIAELEPNLPAADVAPVSTFVRTSMAGYRFYGVLMGSFAGLALLLAAAGIYASMLYAVRQRTRELGIRLALGAKARDVTRMVVRDAARLGGFGLVLGSLGALAAGKTVRGLLVGVEPTDPFAFAGAVVLLALTVLIAAYRPARRAGAANPLDVLRSE